MALQCAYLSIALTWFSTSSDPCSSLISSAYRCIPRFCSQCMTTSVWSRYIACVPNEAFATLPPARPSRAPVRCDSFPSSQHPPPLYWPLVQPPAGTLQTQQAHINHQSATMRSRASYPPQPATVPPAHSLTQSIVSFEMATSSPTTSLNSFSIAPAKYSVHTYTQSANPPYTHSAHASRRATFG